jgi:tRNA threonylcarbamoyladenosine biosynthesis protein TsaB
VILGLDTATPATVVALWDASREVAREARDDPPAGGRPRHAACLLPLIAALFEGGEIAWDYIERIAVGVGPGTFTGLRIGVATARALSTAREIPLVGISTLRSLALGASSDQVASSDAVLAVLDARRGEVFAAAWRPSEMSHEEIPPLLAPTALSPQMLAEKTSSLGSTVLAVGPGAVEFRTVLDRAGTWIPPEDSDVHRVSAVNHCRLASTRSVPAPDEVEPEYLRLPDVEIRRRAATP